MPWVYILKCSDGSFYVGSTRHIDARVEQHQRGEGALYTKRRRPVELVYACEFDGVDEAFYFEKRIQGWRREKRIALIEGKFADLPNLSRNHQGRTPSA